MSDQRIDKRASPGESQSKRERSELPWVVVPFARESQHQKHRRPSAQQNGDRKAARDAKGSPQGGFAHTQDRQGSKLKHE
jgi:hypothetical protein